MPLQFASFLKLFASIWFVALLIFASSIDFALSPVQKPESEQMWMWIILGLRIDCSLITDLLSKGKAVEAQKDSSVMPSHLKLAHTVMRMSLLHKHISSDIVFNTCNLQASDSFPWLLWFCTNTTVDLNVVSHGYSVWAF